MGEQTGIEWTHHTWSPWWGCTKVSNGCKNCYADTLSHRWGHNVWGPSAPRRFFGDKHWNDPVRWNRAAQAAGERRRVFPSMCDPFEDRPDLEEPRSRMFELIMQTPWLDWLLVTKRPENIRRMWMTDTTGKPLVFGNIWLLTSIEDQPTADKRIPELLKCRELSPVLGLSAEPLLGLVDLKLWQSEGLPTQQHPFRERCWMIDWVIVGGESQAGARPMHPDWARALRDQCQEAGVPFFFKQWGEWSSDSHTGTTIKLTIDGKEPDPKAPNFSYLKTNLMFRAGKKNTGSKLDGREWKEFPIVESARSAQSADKGGAA